MGRGVVIRLCSFERFATAIVVLIALPTCLVFAQTSTSTATILRVVKDTSGALIPVLTILSPFSFQVYLRATLSSRCGASPPRVGQYSHLPSLVTHVEAPLGTLSRNFVTSPVGDTLNTVIPLDV